MHAISLRLIALLRLLYVECFTFTVDPLLARFHTHTTPNAHAHARRISLSRAHSPCHTLHAEMPRPARAHVVPLSHTQKTHAFTGPQQS